MPRKVLSITVLRRRADFLFDTSPEEIVRSLMADPRRATAAILVAVRNAKTRSDWDRIKNIRPTRWGGFHGDLFKKWLPGIPLAPLCDVIKTSDDHSVVLSHIIALAIKMN